MVALLATPRAVSAHSGRNEKGPVHVRSEAVHVPASGSSRTVSEDEYVNEYEYVRTGL